eukprot:2817449-Pleurochrysis_carterae.AAC.1
MSCGPSHRVVTLLDVARTGTYAGAVTDAVRPAQVGAAVAKYKEQGPVQNPECVGLEKEPTSEDQATVCDVKATHVLRVARSD